MSPILSLSLRGILWAYIFIINKKLLQYTKPEKPRLFYKNIQNYTYFYYQNVQQSNEFMIGNIFLAYINNSEMEG